MINKTRMS